MTRHIDHIEDLILDFRYPEFNRIVRSLWNGNLLATTKYDGSLAVVFGEDSEGKFFVSTKSFFNKRSKKIAYTTEDVNKLWPGKPGIQSSLIALLESKLPGVDLNGKVFVADVLWHPGALPKRRRVKPNVVKYHILGWERGIDFRKYTGIVVHTIVGSAELPISATFIPAADVNLQIVVPSSFSPRSENWRVFQPTLHRPINNRLDENTQDRLSVLMKQFVNAQIKSHGNDYLKHITTHQFFRFIRQLDEAAVSKLKTQDGRARTALKNLAFCQQLEHPEVTRLIDGLFIDFTIATKIKVQLYLALHEQHNPDHEQINAVDQHEGFVVQSETGAVKIVDRGGFSFANFRAHNELTVVGTTRG